MSTAAGANMLGFELARHFADDPAVRVAEVRLCTPFPRVDPVWTNASSPLESTTFHCPFEPAAPLLRPRFDGVNLYPLSHRMQIGILPEASVGLDGVVLRDNRAFVFGPETALEDGLRRTSFALTADGATYYEWNGAYDPARVGNLRAIYEAQQRLLSGPRRAEARHSHHRKLASLLVRRGYVYYYHLTHVLPLFCLMRRRLLRDREIQLLTSGVFDEHFTMQGIAADRLVRCQPDTIYTADELVSATPVPFLAPPRELLRLVRATYAPPSRGRPCVVFIRRTRAQRTAFRNQVCGELGIAARADVCVLENHHEILGAVRRYFAGQEVVDFDSDCMTPAEQIKLFARASVIIGAHGSGLANMIFCPKQTCVMELMPERSFFPLFWHLAAALELPYAVHIVPGVSKYENFAVPPEAILSALRMLAVSSRSPQ